MNQSFFLQGYSFWQASENALTPDLSFIPVLQRRRITEVEKIGLYLAQQLKPLPDNCKTVFSSQFGEWQQTLDLIQEFYNEKQISPAGFSHSVHNAMPGIASVLSHDMNNYTTITANEQTIDAGLLETFISEKPVLFIYAEETVPTLYNTVLKNNQKGYGIAFIISSETKEKARKITIKNQSFDKSTTFQELSSIIQNGGTLETSFLRISVDAPI